MKNLILILTVLLFASCQNDEMNIDTTQSTVDTPVLVRECASDEVLQSQLATDPTLALRMNSIEEFTQNFKLSKSKNGLTNKMVNDTLVIPVVVNIVYNVNHKIYCKEYPDGIIQNISYAQIQSQIDVLNEDFNAKNIEFNSTNNTLNPEIFSTVKANIGIKFVLDTIIRKASTVKNWGTNNTVKSEKTGGINVTDPAHKLNIWVCSIGGVGGYSQFPGGNPLTDGIVVDFRYFGRTKFFPPYHFTKNNLGRIATHEVGHWMNLNHTFYYNCSDDKVSDTPAVRYATIGLPTFPKYSTCPNAKTISNPLGILMTMNYMDYTQDSGMSMFTIGQKVRMLSLFTAGGVRESFRQQ